MSKNVSMETKGGGYVVVYIRAQSLIDGKDQRLSAKVWNSGTTFLNSYLSFAGFFKLTYVHTLIGTQLSGFVGAFSLGDGIQVNLSAKV